MKILIFENDYSAIKSSFDLMNIIYFKKALDIRQFAKYQDAGTLDKIVSYDFIFVDIALAIGSKLDGFQIIKELLQAGYPIKQIAILTGHRDMKSRIKEHYIDDEISIIFKPITHEILFKALQKTSV